MTTYAMKTEPSGLWRLRQHMGGMIRALFDADKKSGARDIFARSGAAGALVAGAVAGTHYLYIPMVTAIAFKCVLPLGAAFMAYKAYTGAHDLMCSRFMQDHIAQKKKKWLEKQAGPSRGARFKAWLKRGFGKASLPVVKAVKWASYALGGTSLAAAGTAALALTGVLPAALPVVQAAALGAAAALSLTLSPAVATGAAIAALTLLVPAGLMAARTARRAEAGLKEGFVAAQAKPRGNLPVEISAPAPAPRLPQKKAAANFNVDPRTEKLRLEAAAARKAARNKPRTP